MAGRRNTLLLTAAVLLGGALMAGLAVLLGGGGGEVDDLPVGGGPSGGTTTLSRPDTPSESGERMTAIPDPRLTVVAVSTLGLPLFSARIVAHGPNGMREAEGRVVWDDVELGEWTIEVTHEGYLPGREVVTIVDGAQPEVVVTMYDSVDVRGQLLDSAGAPVPNMLVRFQPVGTPAIPRRSWPATTSDAEGHFFVQLPEPRAYRVGIGPANKPLLESDAPVELSAGEHELLAVVPGTGAVRLVLDDPPSGVLSRTGAAQARLYVLSQNTGSESGGGNARGGPGLPDPAALPGLAERSAPAQRPNPRTGTRQFSTRKKRDGDGSGRPPKDAQGGGAPTDRARQGAAPLGPEWKHRVSQSVQQDGSAVFKGVDGNRDYRLVVEYRRVRFQATRSFRLQEGRSVTLRATLPPLPVGDAGKRLRGVVEPLEVFAEYHTPSAEVPGVGFHWAE